jgi:CDP-6-deoxy-D-xylo-4-hexulose-3-dehydrase
MKKYPLMKNNIQRDDLENVIDYLKQDDPILTNGAKVREFEENWSNWLGVEYSVFVNSGSSANLLSMAVLKNQFPNGGEIIVPPLTWVSDISSVIQNGFKPVFVDIDLDSLAIGADAISKKITKDTVAVFLTHCQGFNGLSDELISLLKDNNIILIEDVCESHGAQHNNKKAGSFGLMSNFSFYYAHHMSTIEGGMICTDDENIYQQLRMLRSHGMVRESNNDDLKNKYISNFPDLNPNFIFAFPSYNVRNTEIGAIIGLNQLNRIDSIVEKRTENLTYFLSKLDKEKYFIDFKIEGSSNYAFNVILKNADDVLLENLKYKMNENEIEFRIGSAGGGNQLRQPYLKNIIKFDPNDFPNIEHVHKYGFYIGNYPTLDFKDIEFIANILNSC